MSGLAAIVHLDQRPVDGASLSTMVAAAGGRTRGGIRRWLDGSVGLVQFGRGEGSLPGAAPPTDQPAWVAVAADCRLDNRRELIARLGLGTGLTDAQVLGAAYVRWGDAFAGQLLGDFAVVVVDRRRSRVLLARDPLGLRPLRFRLEPGRRLLVASEVAQILSQPHVPREINEAQLATFLHGGYRLAGESFHRGIDEVDAGEVVCVESAGPVRRFRAWEPDGRPESNAGARGDHHEHLRALLLEAVEARIPPSGSAALLLSGGVDSGAIALAAGVLRQQRRIPGLTTYSWAFDELEECDERTTSDRVCAWYDLGSVPVPADDAYPLADHHAVGPLRDAPMWWPWVDLERRTYRRAELDGVRVILTGARGDEVIGPVPKWSGPQRLRQAMARTRRRFGSGAGSAESPALGPTLAGLVDPDRLHVGNQPGQGGNGRWERIAGPAAQLLTNLDAGQVAQHGMVLADPWTDRRIIEFVLSLPPDQVSTGGDPKRLARTACSPWMPPGTEFRSSGDLAALYRRGICERRRDLISGYFADSELAARGYIVAEEYQAMFADIVRGVARPFFEWALAAELWLRRYWSDAEVR